MLTGTAGRRRSAASCTAASPPATSERQFHLADYVKVVDARIEGGLLHIDLVRELPETMKPRKVEICTKGGSLLEGKAEKAA